MTWLRRADCSRNSGTPSIDTMPRRSRSGLTTFDDEIWSRMIGPALSGDLPGEACARSDPDALTHFFLDAARGRRDQELFGRVEQQDCDRVDAHARAHLVEQALHECVSGYGRFRVPLHGLRRVRVGHSPCHRLGSGWRRHFGPLGSFRAA